jgi:hypothetical protein
MLRAWSGKDRCLDGIVVEVSATNLLPGALERAIADSKRSAVYGSLLFGDLRDQGAGVINPDPTQVKVRDLSCPNPDGFGSRPAARCC